MPTPESSSPRSRIAVLGLGRMGAAMAARLADRGHDVTGWSRSGRLVPGVVAAPSAAEAAAGADVVLLCLFDGAACREVVDVAAHALRDTTVLNTSTVAPEEATAIATRVEATGGRYVHAPVLGSVPAVAAGTLTILTGGQYDDHARPVLDDLGEVVACGTPADAAAAKLLAAGALGSALLAVRDGRRRATELGVGPDRALTVLERTAFGGLVRAKRHQLEGGGFGDADFTVGALAKDVALLAARAPSASEVHEQVAGALDRGAVKADDDVAALCLTAPAGTDRPHGLTVAPTVTAPAEVLAPLESYVAGHATGDPSHHRRAFLPTAHVEGVWDGRFVSWTVDEYCALFTGRSAPDEAARRRRIDHVHVAGAVGTAAMTLWHGGDVFSDVFVLLKHEGRWRIANKAYHRASA